MKKIFLCLMFTLIALISNAQSMYRAREFAYAEKSYSRWNWTDWYSCNIDITVGGGKVFIDSDSPQLYTIVSDETYYRDSDGGSNISWKVVDQDYDRGTLRIREQKNGVIQMYIEFSNVRWVYSKIKQIY